MQYFKLGLFYFFTLIFASCNSQVESENWDEFKVHYFDFDQVDYYSTFVSEDSLYLLESSNTDNAVTERFIEVLADDVPKNLVDTMFIEELESFGYNYQLVPEHKHYELNDLFREKSFDPSESKWMCLPVYSDILIFKKQNKIVGIAKICFGCTILHVVGTNADTKNFGACKGFWKLQKLLNTN